VLVAGFAFLFFFYFAQLGTVNGSSLRVPTESWSSLVVEVKIGKLRSEKLSFNGELTTRV
jgi:hypothetical protein